MSGGQPIFPLPKTLSTIGYRIGRPSIPTAPTSKGTKGCVIVAQTEQNDNSGTCHRRIPKTCRHGDRVDGAFAVNVLRLRAVFSGAAARPGWLWWRMWLTVSGHAVGFLLFGAVKAGEDPRR